MDSSPVYTEPLRRESVEFVLVHAIRRPQVFATARQHLRPEHFLPLYEYPHNLLWQAMCELHDEYHELPPSELLATRALQILSRLPLLDPAAEEQLLSLHRWCWEAWPTEDSFHDAGAIELLQQFLKERAVNDPLRRVWLDAMGKVPTNLPAVLQRYQETLTRIEAIHETHSAELIPEEMETRDVVYMPTGVEVIDEYMDGGSCPGECHVVLAPTGVGKTMLGVEIAGKRAEQQLMRELERPGSGMLSVLVSYEAPWSEMRSRLICYAAEIDKSRVEHMRDYRELSRTGALQEYEQRRWRAAIAAGQTVPGEYERLMRVRDWVNKLVHIADFSMSREEGRRPRGSGGVMEVQQYLDSLVQKTGRKIGTLVIDWAGQCVVRYLQSSKKDVQKNLTIEMTTFVDAVHTHLTTRYGCDAWIFHQLNAEACKKKFQAEVHHSEALWCGAFAVNAWFAFCLGAKDKENSVSMLSATKTRRGEAREPVMCKIDGAFGRLERCHGLQIDPISQALVTTENAVRLGIPRPTAPPAVRATGSSLPQGF